MFKEKSQITREEYLYKDKTCGHFTHLLDKDECADGVKFYTKITMIPGSEVDYHQHKDEWEVFHFLSGTGEVNDNGKLVQVKAGDVIITPQDGWHSFKNTGNDNLVFTALIIKP